MLLTHTQNDAQTPVCLPARCAILAREGRQADFPVVQMLLGKYVGTNKDNIFINGLCYTSNIWNHMLDIGFNLSVFKQFSLQK